MQREEIDDGRAWLDSLTDALHSMQLAQADVAAARTTRVLYDPNEQRTEPVRKNIGSNRTLPTYTAPAMPSDDDKPAVPTPGTSPDILREEEYERHSEPRASSKPSPRVDVRQKTGRTLTSGRSHRLKESSDDDSHERRDHRRHR
jgi:hypothetical protein